MKIILIILLVLGVFCCCAAIGYYAATQLDPTLPPIPVLPQPTAVPIPDLGGEQHNMLVVQVDQLDSQEPRLQMVWFMSVFFMEDVPPAITFVQLYSPQATNEHAHNLEQAFSLTQGGEPSNEFWKALEVFDVDWEGYFLVDQFSAQFILEWANGSGDYTGPLMDPQRLESLVQQTCQSVSGMAMRETVPFNWNSIAPTHFRSNVRMAEAMEYWNEITSTEQTLRCDLIPAH